MMGGGKDKGGGESGDCVGGRLDLSFNNLTCVPVTCSSNLKWVNLSHNNLQSLSGIESLSNLAVLNAAGNKLHSIDEVTSLTALRALILNDNLISSIPSLQRLQYLNTLVLSKNPISQIGHSLSKSTSLTKLSVSHCQLGSINSSLKSCVALKELRLAHNRIKSLPADLAHNKILLNLDLGYNAIATWSDVKVLASLLNLRNLNVQGNPIASHHKLVQKVKNILPKLRVFNAKPINNYTETAKGGPSDKNYVSHSVAKHKGQEENAKDEEDIITRVKRSQVDVIDDGQVSFAELIDGENIKETLFQSKIVTGKAKRKKHKNTVEDQVQVEVQVEAQVEVGMGGPSTWGDH